MIKEKKLILGSSTIQINNKIMELFDQTGANWSYHEDSYLEDLRNSLWEQTPDMVIINDHLLIRERMNSLQRDQAFYKFITEELEGVVVVLLLTGSTDKSRLVERLIQDGFYHIIPVAQVERILDLPKSEEEVNLLLEGEKEMPEESLAEEVERPPEEEASVEKKSLVGELITTEKDPDEQEAPQPVQQQNELRPFPKSDPNYPIGQNDFTRSLVSVFWSPIGNVGVSTIMKAIAFRLAQAGRKVLIVELDVEYPKMARTTGLTHQDKDIFQAVRSILNKQPGLAQNVVNNEIAIEGLPHTYREVKKHLKLLPNNLYLLSANAELKHHGHIYFNEDDDLIERLFYEAKQEGFQHILVDVPSSPNDLLTNIPLLFADERFAVVDDSFSTNGLYFSAIEALKDLQDEKTFDLIINKTREFHTEEDIAEFYQREPVLSIPYRDEVVLEQINLRWDVDIDIMAAVDQFNERYGIQLKNEGQKKKRFFGKKSS
ncbi:AAA family ATPase [Alkalihalobacillus oceani]|uniref:AAA family ATPase n=1 Tax=Halalkalibacter oceani TaxID=1653776 RepID=A0A9X2DTA1_9BACI|nr:AAA family ATPase [Halalkalibacter oceani]MCM3716579.1 AAA family ATPase [Halalkalibacter oceani]